MSRGRKIVLGLVGSPLVLLLLLNANFLLGSRGGLGEWDALSDAARKRLAGDKQPAREKILTLVRDPLTRSNLEIFRKFADPSAESYSKRRSRPEYQGALRWMSELQENRLGELLRTGSIVLSYGSDSQPDDLEQIELLLWAHAQFGLELWESGESERALGVFSDNLTQLTLYPPAFIFEQLNVCDQRLRSLARNLELSLQKEPGGDSALVRLDQILASADPPPADIVPRTLDNTFWDWGRTIEKTDRSGWWNALFPGWLEYVWRSHLALYLRYRPLMVDYRRPVSVKKTYQRSLEKMGWLQYPGATPRRLTDMAYDLKRTQDEVSAARIVAALQRYRAKNGIYPERLEQLKSIGFEIPPDLFNDKGFSYKRLPESEGFELSSRSNWHPERGVRYF